LKKLLLLISLITLTNCSTSIPKADNFEQSSQKKMMSAQHWNAIARDAVERTRWTLSKKGFSSDTPLFLSENTNTVFDYAFKKYMIANFVEAGSLVSTKKEGAIEIKYDTQVIKHAAAFDPEKLGYKPGQGSAAVSSFWILRDVLSGVTSSGVLGTFALAGAYDGYKATNPGETGIELLLTTSITYEDIYVMQNADAYYIENGETWLFEECKGRNRRYCK
jgi:hypothetical protein